MVLRLPVVLLLVLAAPVRSWCATYYVRPLVGRDANDGRTPATAWPGIERLGSAMRAGDTVYVGPGVYRETIILEQSGTAEARITVVADPTGAHTGDPPGPVVIAGTDPVDETGFTPSATAGVFQAPSPPYPVLGVVEMDGPQRRYLKAADAPEHVKEGLPALDVVARRPASYHYDSRVMVLYLHTSDGKPPRAHEIEIVRRANGIYVPDRHYVTISGFTLRHMGDAGIAFFRGSRGGVAMHNTAYGSHQGVWVYGAPDTLVYANTLFGNDNSGVYFAAGATGGRAVGNSAYENAKGLRFGSESNDGMALDNALFDNHECGLALEGTERLVVRDNRPVNNAVSQLLVMKAGYDSDRNCFQTGSARQLIADFVGGKRFPTLASYQSAMGEDRGSREGRCGRLPEKVDVRRLYRGG